MRSTAKKLFCSLLHSTCHKSLDQIFEKSLICCFTIHLRSALADIGRHAIMQCAFHLEHMDILWMEEIPHQLKSVFFPYLFLGFQPSFWWCRISSIISCLAKKAKKAALSPRRRSAVDLSHAHLGEKSPRNTRGS